MANGVEALALNNTKLPFLFNCTKMPVRLARMMLLANHVSLCAPEDCLTLILSLGQ